MSGEQRKQIATAEKDGEALVGHPSVWLRIFHSIPRQGETMVHPMACYSELWLINHQR